MTAADVLDWAAIIAAGIDVDRVRRQPDGVWTATRADGAIEVHFGYDPGQDGIEPTGTPGEVWIGTAYIDGQPVTTDSFDTVSGLLYFVRQYTAPRAEL